MRHRRSGALEPRRRFILSGRQAFSAPIRRGTRVALAILSVRAESFLLNLSGELPSADGRRFAVPTAVGKRVDTCGFYPLNSRFPLFPNPAQTRDRRPLRKGERQRILSTVGAHNVRPFLYLYAVSDFVLLHRRVHLRRRDITVSRNSLVGGCGRHLQATIINKLYRRVRRPRRTVSND